MEENTGNNFTSYKIMYFVPTNRLGHYNGVFLVMCTILTVSGKDTVVFCYCTFWFFTTGGGCKLEPVSSAQHVLALGIDQDGNSHSRSNVRLLYGYEYFLPHQLTRHS